MRIKKILHRQTTKIAIDGVGRLLYDAKVSTWRNENISILRRDYHTDLAAG